jgi:hypothetical protein
MLWKGLIEEMFDDLLRFMFPGIDEEVDFTKGIIFLDKEFGAIDPKPAQWVERKVVVSCGISGRKGSELLQAYVPVFLSDIRQTSK